MAFECNVNVNDFQRNLKFDEITDENTFDVNTLLRNLMTQQEQEWTCLFFNVKKKGSQRIKSNPRVIYLCIFRFILNFLQVYGKKPFLAHLQNGIKCWTTKKTKFNCLGKCVCVFAKFYLFLLYVTDLKLTIVEGNEPMQ